MSSILATQPTDVLVGAALWVLFVSASVGIEAFRVRSRRRFVVEWAAQRELRVTECRWTFHWFRTLYPFWLVPYRVRVVDKRGREMTGTAWATGLLRRKAWVDVD